MTYRVKQIGLSTLQWDARDPMPVPYGTQPPETCQPCWACLGTGAIIDGLREELRRAKEAQEQSDDRP